MSPWTEITDRWDDPDAYDSDESYYGEGRYPPDWKRRCRVIWEQQADRCGRCGRARDKVDSADVHHLRPLDQGGSNALANLAGLCGDCHSLMHPLNEGLNGDWADAPPFPAVDAVPSVATVRTPTTRDEFSAALRSDLETIESVSSPTQNEAALSTHTYDIEAEYARRLPDDTTDILQSHGVIAASSDYHTMTITVTLAGIRGLLTTYTPELVIETDGALVETTDWQGRWRTVTAKATLSEDTTTATVEVTDGRGTTARDVPLDSASVETTFTARPPALLGVR